MPIKGYSDKAKTDAGTPDFATLAPIREQQIALDVVAHTYFQLIGTDAAEAGTTTRTIVATGHAALVGDVIGFTSGALATKEYRVTATATNSITVAEVMSAAPAALDTFQILRAKTPLVTAAGLLNIAATINVDQNYGPVDVLTTRTVEGGRVRGIAPVSYDHTVPVLTSAYTQIIASTGAACTSIYIADTSGCFLILAFGAALSEVNQMYLAPGFAGWINISVPVATRVSITALNTATAGGYFIISGLS